MNAKFDTLIDGDQALKWALRDLPALDQIVKMARGRTAVVQAGGNLGVYPKRLAESFETVYTFEPSEDLFPLLVKNAPERNIVRFQAALGCRRELVSMSMSRRDGKRNVHEGITHVAGAGTIPTLLVDDLRLPTCDLLYLDTEGYELYGLAGAVDTLHRCRPVVAVEINKSCGYYGIAAGEVREYLKAQGYSERAAMHSDVVFLPDEWGAP